MNINEWWRRRERRQRIRGRNFNSGKERRDTDSRESMLQWVLRRQSIQSEKEDDSVGESKTSCMRKVEEEEEEEGRKGRKGRKDKTDNEWSSLSFHPFSYCLLFFSQIQKKERRRRGNRQQERRRKEKGKRKKNRTLSDEASQEKRKRRD